MDTELLEDIFSVLPRFYNRLYKISDNLLENYSISKSHIRLIYILKKCGLMTVTELGKMLSMSKPSITVLVDKLVKMNMVERKYDETDRRIIHLQLTPKGDDFITSHIEATKKSFYEMFGKLNDEDIQILKDTIGNMKKILSKISDGTS